MKFSNKPFIPFCAVLSLAVLFAAIFTGCEQPGGVSLPPSVNIGSAGDLAKIGADAAYPLNGNYTLTANLTLADWTPIGTDTSPFTGTFDGGGHTVTITGIGAAAVQASPYIGLFGYVKNGTVRRVKLSGTMNVSRDSAAASALFAGGIAGYLENSSLLDISSDMVMNAESVRGFVYAGGLAGFGRNLTITRCTGTGVVSAAGRGHNSSAGGIAGYLAQSAVSDCRAAGNISLQAGDASDPSGDSYLYMIYAGGLAGYTGDKSRTERSSASGAVYAKAPYPYAGGLVGYNYGDPSGAVEGSVVAACYAAGGVTAESTKNGLPYAGGLAGYNSRGARLEDSYATGAVKAQTDSKSAWAGGIAGSCAASAVISRCYARGKVEALTGSYGLAAPQPGAGDGALAGGIAGYVYFSADTIVENCAALNSRLAASGGGTPWGVHRIAGRIDASPPQILNNIGSTAISYTAAPSADAAPNGLDGADTTAPPAQAVYQTTLGWDFTSVWKMNGGYPVLQWQ
ncbi:MAG: hypothetical protein LBQ55_08105 [Treponema sp.]|jgi:hypothetical protein|nr:hypothetical protein [Treponema sp.]